MSAVEIPSVWDTLEKKCIVELEHTWLWETAYLFLAWQGCYSSAAFSHSSFSLHLGDSLTRVTLSWRLMVLTWLYAIGSSHCMWYLNLLEKHDRKMQPATIKGPRKIGDRSCPKKKLLVSHLPSKSHRTLIYLPRAQPWNQILHHVLNRIIEN